MNKTDKLAQEQFGGDLEQTISHIMQNFETKELNEYVMEFNQEQSDIFLGLLAKEINIKIPEKEKKAIAERSFYMAALDMTEKDLDSIDLGSYKKDIAKKIMILLVVAVGTPCISFFLPQHQDAVIAVGVLSTNFLVWPLAQKIIEFMRIRKLKKIR